MGSLLSLFFIKDRSCFRSNYFKYIETEAVLFPESPKEGVLLTVGEVLPETAADSGG
jgi:hypothetical protein